MSGREHSYQDKKKKKKHLIFTVHKRFVKSKETEVLNEEHKNTHEYHIIKFR